MTRRPLRLLDLFCGAGGLTEGFLSTGHFTPVGAVEWDFDAAATYAANHGDHVFVGDIRDWLENDLPEADVVVGGPPCQGFSMLGKRDVNDPRNLLWREYVDTLRRVKPLYFVIENVPAFLSSAQIDSLQRSTGKRGRLSDYALELWLLNAVDFGVPQARKRAIVVGRHRDLSPLGDPTPARPGLVQTVRQAIGDLDALVRETDLPDATHVFRGVARPGAFKSRDLHVTRRPMELSLKRYEAIPPGGNRSDLPIELMAPCWVNHRTGSADVMGRLHWDRPSVTIRTEFYKPEKGRYLHPESNRPITHFEASRLQSFPDDYLWVGSKTSIARQIGNAVPVGMARGLAKHLLKPFGL